MKLNKFNRIGQLSYGELDSNIFYDEERNSSIEVVNLGEKKIVRGSKSYFIKDVADEEEFHSRLSSIGNFTDYLKESVPSFELSLFYMNSLPSGVIQIDDRILEGRIGELEKRIRIKKGKKSELEFDQQAGVPVGRDRQKVESQIKEMEKELENLKEEKRFEERFREEMKKKGMGATFLIRARSPVKICREENIERAVDEVLDDLQHQNNVVKQKARKGFQIVLEDMDFPPISYAAESVGMFDPEEIERLVEKEGLEELERLKGELEKLFVYRPASDIELERRKFEGSGAITQGISSLLSRVKETPEERKEEKKLPQPDYDRLPKLGEDKRLGYLGMVLEDVDRKSNQPYLFDLDQQGPQHTMVVGASGSGKSVTAMNLAENALFYDVPVIVFDTTGQWTGFAKKLQNKSILSKYSQLGMEKTDPRSFRTKIYTPGSDFGLGINTNLLSCPEIEDEAKLKSQANEVSSIIEVLCDLSKRERNYVKSVVSREWKEGKDLDFDSLPEELKDWAEKGEKQISNLLIRLQELETYPFLFSGERMDIEDLWKPGEISVVSLNHLDQDQMVFAAYNLMREILSHFYKEPDSDSLRLLVVLEESHRFIPGQSPNVPSEMFNILERIVREMRRKGVGTVLVSQVLSDFKRSLRANASTKIWMKVSYERDIERARKNLGNEYSEKLPNLETGRGIVDYADFGRAAFVEFRPPLHSPYSLSNEEIGERMEKYREGKVEIPTETLSPKKREEAQEKLESIPEEKLEALKSLVPEIYELIDDLRVKEKREEEKSDVDLLLREINKFDKREGKPPKASDMKDELSWGWKRLNKAVSVLVERGEIEKVKDQKDGRVRRLQPR